MIKEAIIFSVGATIGAGITYYFLKDKYRSMADDEIASMRNFYEKRSDRPRRVRTEPETAETGTDVASRRRDYTTLYSGGSMPEKTWSSLPTEMERAETESPEEDDESEEDGSGDEDPDAILTEKLESQRNRKPRIIKVEEFGEEDGFGVSELFYYYDDSVVTNEEDQIVEDANDLLGDCLDKYGWADDPVDHVLYVRNYKYSIDYEITKVNGSFN